MERFSLNGRDREEAADLLIFAEGAVLRPVAWWRLYDHRSYVPAGSCVDLLREWARQGASIACVTSRRGAQAGEIAQLLTRSAARGRCASPTWRRMSEDKSPPSPSRDSGESTICRASGTG